MNIPRISCVSLLAAVLGAAFMPQASQDNPPPAPRKPDLSGLHDFDLRASEWVAHNRRLKERLAGSHEWEEFDGTQSFRLLMDGYANEDENVLSLPGGNYKGVTLRAYDSKTARALCVVEHHGGLRALGTGFFARRRQDLGGQLDHGFQAREVGYN